MLMKKERLHESHDQIFKDVELSLAAIHEVKSVRELWSLVTQTLSRLPCQKALLYCPSFSFEGHPKVSKIQLFQGCSSLLKTELTLCNEDALTLIQNIELNRSIQLGPAKPTPISLLKGVVGQELKDSLTNDFDEIYVTEYFGFNGYAGFTIFKLDSEIEIEIDAGLCGLVLQAFFAAIHKKKASLVFDEIRQNVSISPRENDVLQLLAKGKSNAEIAENLEISKHTISSYVKVLSLKLNSKNRTVTALRAIALGLSKS